jgi:hypothetical protein
LVKLSHLKFFLRLVKNASGGVYLNSERGNCAYGKDGVKEAMITTLAKEQANKCMLMAAIAYNLKKLLKFTARKVQTNVQSMQVYLHTLFFKKRDLTKPTYF